jgi:hypothetical protein
MAADEPLAVKSFAEKHFAELAIMIASEKRRVEAKSKMRNRIYDEDDDKLDDDDGNE